MKQHTRRPTINFFWVRLKPFVVVGSLNITVRKRPFGIRRQRCTFAALTTGVPMRLKSRLLQRSSMVVTVAVVASVVGLVPAQATNPGIEGRIAYVSGGHLHVMDPDGANDHDITPAGCEDANEPHWAPDSSVITYINRCGPTGTWDIATIKPNGTGFQPIVATAGDDAGASFSPDGSRIAYCSNVDGDSEIFTADPDGTHKTKLTTNTVMDCAPTWSPDGTRIAFESTRDTGGYVLYTMAADGSDVVRVTTGYAIYPSWSSDGTRILFTGDSGMTWIHPDGTGERLFTSWGSNLNFPEWSPDSTEIAGEFSGQIVVMNSDGTGQTVITPGTQPSWEPLPGDGDPNVWFDSPEEVQLGADVTLQGALAVPGGTSSGQQLHIFGYSQNGSETELGTVSTDGTGAFEFTTTPAVGGAWTYRVELNANANHAAAQFWSVVVVTKYSSVMTISGPKRILAHNKVVLTGDLTINGAPAPNTTVALYVASPSTGLHKQETGKTDADGSYRFDSTPTNEGRWTYEVEFKGNATSEPVQASTSVDVYRITTAITLQIPRTHVTYGQPVSLKVHLTRAPARAKVTIVVFDGKSTSKVTSGTARNGRYSTKLRPQTGGSYYAVFDGDDHHQGSHSTAVGVTVQYDLQMHAMGFAQKSGSHVTYRYNTSCASNPQVCVHFHGEVGPFAGLGHVTFIAEYRAQGKSAWHPYFTFKSKVYSKGEYGVLIGYKSTEIKHFEFRIQSVVDSKRGLTGVETPWIYYRIV